MSELHGAELTWDRPETIEKYNASRLLVQEARTKLLKNVIRSYVDPRGPTLEAGAGLGDLYQFVPWSHHWRYAVTDNSAVYVEAMRKKGIPAQQANLSDLHFADESFRTVVSQSVLTAVDNVPACIAEQQRVLRPGGKIVAIHDLLPTAPPLMYDLLEIGMLPLPKGCGEATGFQLLPLEQMHHLVTTIPDRDIQIALLKYYEDPIREFLQLSDIEPAFFQKMAEVIAQSGLTKQTPSLKAMFDEKLLRTLAQYGFSVEMFCPDMQVVTKRRPEHDSPLTATRNNIFVAGQEKFTLGYSQNMEKVIGTNKVIEHASVQVVVATKT